MRKTAYQMRELAACALHGKVPSQELLAQVDPEKLYIMCQFHCLTAMVAVALRSAGIRSPQWEEEHVKAVRKSILLAAERRKLCEFLEQNGIWYLPLKGIVLESMYPEIGMRQMADNDILYDKTARDKVRAFLTANGYQAISFGKSHHAVYQKPPVYHFEMHVSLYPAGREKRIEAYYANPERLLRKDAGHRFGCHMTAEDFYLYMIAHTHKHATGCGTGLRALLDIYVYLQQKSEVLDWTYLTAELRQLGLSEFEQQMRQLSLRVFSAVELPALSADERKQLESCLISGAYGTVQQGIQRQMQAYCAGETGGTKWHYLVQRVFPPRAVCQARFPALKRYPFLLPVCWVIRLVQAVITQRKHLLLELRCFKELRND